MMEDPLDNGFRAYRQVSYIVAGAQLFGLVALLPFAAQATSLVSALSVLAIAVMLAIAAFAVGGIIGFLFGIPRLLQEATAAAPPADGTENKADEAARRVRYAGNTSLEQISDWLTKILVGVGLTQLANIPSALAAVGSSFGPSLGGFTGSAVLAPLEVVFFGTGGFFLSYLWTRLYLASLLIESDEEAKRRTAYTNELRALDVSRRLQAAVPPGSQPERVHEAGSRKRVLWVDDRPSNNVREREGLAAQGIGVTTSTSTDDALTELAANAATYGLVISDMARGIDRRAGYTMLRQMRERGIQTPVVFYAGGGSSAHDVESRERGALGSTNSPVRLFELVQEALSSGPDAP